MSKDRSIRIAVDMNRLSTHLRSSAGRYCLDLATGQIVDVAERSPDAIGDGRPAVRRGKRFIRIPSLGELIPEETAGHSTESERRVAAGWIASLKPPFRVGWLEVGIGVRFYYDPDRDRWYDVEQLDVE